MEFLLQHLLQQSASTWPQNIAVSSRGREITYRDLERQSDALANAFLQSGVEPGDRIGIYHTKSIESVVGMMAALKAGAVYVPVDPLAPAKRVAYIIANCGIRHLICSSDKLSVLLEQLDKNVLQQVYLTDDTMSDLVAPILLWAQIMDGNAAPVHVDRVETDLAYILYTSGTTGNPKGVMISHRAALTFINWAHDEFGVTVDDVVANHAPLHFDLSVFDIYVSLKAGARIELVPAELSTFPSMLTRFWIDRKITIWYSVPTALILMLQKGGLGKHRYPDLRLVLFAGEVFPIKYLLELRSCVDARLCNLYGPTETNVCTYYDASDIPPDADQPVPIGSAIANYEVFALTTDGSLAQAGEEGELYARGPGLMSGYWGDMEKTHSRLVQNPLNSIFDDKVYRTGDIVVQTPEGDYLYVSRVDNMIKSRGYRIELGEIEAALYQHQAVVEAAAVAVPDEELSNRIEAYITVNEAVEVNELLRHCQAILPKYMVPESLKVIDSMPKTSTGKIDRKALT